ncbi:MAG: formylglycine-generating enzyme family protein [Myxococcota bacterium]
MKRAALALALALAFGALQPPARAETHLALEPPRRIWLARGSFVRGATDAAIDAAVDRCQRRSPRSRWGPCSRRVFGLEGPPRRIVVSAYGIDRTEVTQAAWDRCVRAGACVPSRTPAAAPGLAGPRLPVTGITSHEAAAFCRFAGGRLPTEAEWERAARGPGGRAYPWGELFNDRLANHGDGTGRGAIDGFSRAAPVGSFPQAASPHGLLDAAGNVWEWVADRYAEGSYARGPSVDPRGPATGGGQLIRGGSWRESAERLRVTHRVPIPAGDHLPDLGFRCAYDAPPAGWPGARATPRR